MKISLLHPSRGRPSMAFKTAKKWINSAGVEIQYILSLDTDDLEFEFYSSPFDWHSNCDLLINKNSSLVEATNKAAHRSEGEILIYLSDDFECPDNWGELVLKEFENENRPLVIKVDDMLQKNHVPVLTIPIMNRALYERLGYFWNPAYKSMFCDVDLYYTAKHIGALKNAFHLKFPHNHHSIGKAENDETYRRSEANWKHGEEIFNRRKKQGFPI